MNQPTAEQMKALLRYASARLGVSEQELVKAAADGGYEGLSQSLSDDGKRTLQALVSDPQKAEVLLSSPTVRAFLERFS